MSTTWAAYRRARRQSRQAWALIALLLAGAASGLVWFFAHGQFTVSEGPGNGPSEAPVVNPGWMKPVQAVEAIPSGLAVDALDTLPVKGRAAKDDYRREEFGQAWLDVDRNGCDTRNDILRRDLESVEFTAGSTCKVASGTLREPYVGHDVQFRRGAESSAAVQIDHVVALGDAWQKGARQLTPKQRQSLANDPVNLIAVDGPANVKKSASDAASWLPANKRFRCHYVARQVSVKVAYRLWVTQAEKDAMRRVLDSCPGQQTIRTS
ncbi:MULTISPECIES: HNH endonuclease family protein [Arthrobacter]|uniref:HNH endonuclease n=1 Tax=Arthrobacter terricola TaxID=2547396 RepID=A0A4R5KY49_9MICC|nr:MULTISPECIES: HNH endonuclease family protein [Arthrobacter]MBT8160256.1 HNH endonuclease family protein [Arthrobacter sp. GN70]TDG00038.1 HNH endonuclease [Arthrobacter terricola]